MIVGVLTTCQTNTLEIGVFVFFYLIKQHSKFLLHNFQVLYMCTLCDSTNVVHTFFHIRTVHLYIIKVLFIHQLMH